jgi:NaMN:DMB phosphoribosyltransferase
VTTIPEKTREYYVHLTFVCPDPECSYFNDKEVLVFAKTQEQAREKVTLICEGCRKPVFTSYAILVLCPINN